jgi:dihydroflavonol-4-reductase
VERLFHAAGLVSLVQRDRPRLHAVNVEGTRNSLQAALDAGVPRVIYTSSISAVAYSRQPELANESSIWRDFGIGYPRSKRQAEAVAFEFHRRGLPLVVLNPTTAMGPNDRSLTATGPVARYLTGELKVRVDGGLNVIDVEDFAAGHVLADERGKVGERYVLGGSNVTWLQFFTLLDELTGRGVPRRIPSAVAYAMAALMELAVAPLSGKRPKFYLDEVRSAVLYRFADASKAICDLGLPQRPLRETLERTVKWLRSTGRDRSV